MLNILKGMFFISVLGLISLLALLFFRYRAEKRFGLAETRIANDRWRVLRAKSYERLSRGVLTKRYIADIRERIAMTTSCSEEQLRKRTLDLFLASLAGVSALSVVFISLTREPFLILFFFFALFFLSENIIDFFVENLRNRLIRQQIVYNDILRMKFYEHRMVDEALEETNGHLYHERHMEMVHQGKRIHEIIDSTQAETEALKYYDTAPNKYLKLLTGMCLITKEYGDRQVKGASLFMGSMSYLSNEIRIEVDKRDSLNLALKSLNLIIISPLFFMRPVKDWAVNNFYPLEKFYGGHMGFVVEITMLLIIALAYMGLRRIQQVEDVQLPTERKVWPMKVYVRFKKWLIYLIPAEGSKAGRKHGQRCKDTATTERIESFYTRKWSLGILSMILALGVILIAQRLAIHAAYTAPTSDNGLFSGKLGEEERQAAEAISAADREYLDGLVKGHFSTGQLYETLKSDTRYTDEAAEKLYDRVLQKYAFIKKQRFGGLQGLMAMAAFAFAFCLPDLEAWFKKQIIRIELEHEISQYQSIITLLMHVPQVTLMDLLEWMERFSVLFREPLQRAMLDYDSGAYEALEALKAATSYHEFHKLIEKMQAACEGLSIVQAFDDLDAEKLYYQEKKKRMNEELVRRKVNLGQVVGFLPAYGFLVIYIMIPMLWSSIAEMQAYFKVLQGF